MGVSFSPDGRYVKRLCEEGIVGGTITNAVEPSTLALIRPGP